MQSFPYGQKAYHEQPPISLGELSERDDTMIWSTHLEGGDVRSVGIWWEKNHTSTFPPEIKIMSHIMNYFEISPVIQSMTPSTVTLGQAWSDLGVCKIVEQEGRQRFSFDCDSGRPC